MAGSRPLDMEEFDAVCAALGKFPTRDRLYTVLALNLGLRLRELTSLTVGQLWDGTQPRAFLRIERQQLKLGRSPTRRRSVASRTLPLNCAARAAITAHLSSIPAFAKPAALRSLVFAGPSGRALSRMQVSRILRRIFVAAGIDVSSRLGSHSLRKSYCARIWESSGHDIEVTRASLGHRHITTTQAYLPSGEAKAHALMLALAEPPACGSATSAPTRQVRP